MIVVADAVCKGWRVQTWSVGGVQRKISSPLIGIIAFMILPRSPPADE